MLYNFFNPGILLIVLSAILRLITSNRRPYFALGFITLAYIFFCTTLRKWSFYWFDQFLFSDERAMFIVISLFFLALFVASFLSAFEKQKQDIAALHWLFVYVGSTISILFTSHLLFILLFLELATLAATFVIFCSKNSAAANAGLTYLKFHIIGGAFFLMGIMQHYVKYQSFQFSNYDLQDTFFMLGLLINLAIIPFSYWLLRAYSAASTLSTIVLSACTTKIVALLAMNFLYEQELLVIIGCLTTTFGILFAFMETNLRLLICYFMIAKIGLTLIYIGFGQKMMYTTFVAIVNDLICIPALMCCIALLKTELRVLKVSLIVLPLLSLAGFPYTLGYIAKFYSQAHWWLNLLYAGVIIIACCHIPHVIMRCKCSKLGKHISAKNLFVYSLPLIAFNLALISLNIYFMRLFLIKINLLSAFISKQLALFLVVIPIYLIFKKPKRLAINWHSWHLNLFDCRTQWLIKINAVSNIIQTHVERMTVISFERLKRQSSSINTSQMLIGMMITALILILLAGLFE